MNQCRRRVLRVLGASSVVGLAGCSGEDDEDDTDTDSDTDSDTDTDTDQPSAGLATEQASKLTADDGDREDRFGKAVAMSADGSTAIIGAYNDEDPNGESSGSAYVFTGDSGTWTQQAKLTADDGDREDRFGGAVAMSADGSTAIIGAYNDEDPNGESSGSAYVFTGDSGTWTQRAKLTADDGDSDDGFGIAVAMSAEGSTAIIGAPESAYVFTGDSGTWTQQAKLTADDGDSDDGFGGAVAVSGDGLTALIGASDADGPNVSDAGSAYVFTGGSGTWTQQAKLTADNGDSGDLFGWSVAVSDDGSTAIIGAYNDDAPNAPDAGSAYVFTGGGGTWTQQAKLTADDGDRENRFGSSVAMSADGSTTLIGASDADGSYVPDAGSAYVFTGGGGTWTQQAKLTADDGELGDLFGSSVAMSAEGSTTIIGALAHEGPYGIFSGSAYVFE